MALLVFALFLLSVDVTMSQSCGLFPASFLAVIDQNIDSPFGFLEADPDLKEILKFREDAIQHTFDNVLRFFNESFGLDFSSSPPNEQNMYVYQYSTLGPYKLSDDIEYLVTLNNWIQTGSTRSSCYRINDGGISVTFSREQTLHGTYGGNDGNTVGVTDFLLYGFYSIDVCSQSPVVIQYQTATPFRQEQVGGASLYNSNLYNRVLGYGKVQGVTTITPSLDDPGKFRLVTRNAFIFKSQGNN